MFTFTFTYSVDKHINGDIQRPDNTLEHDHTVPVVMNSNIRILARDSPNVSVLLSHLL